MRSVLLCDALNGEGHYIEFGYPHTRGIKIILFVNKDCVVPFSSSDVVCFYTDANSTEFNAQTSHPVVSIV